MKRREAEIASVSEELQQRKWWRGGDGTIHKRKDMSAAHKANVLAWLVRNAASVVFDYTSKPVFLCAPDEVQDDLDRIERYPEEWVLNTPFVLALLADLTPPHAAKHKDPDDDEYTTAPF